MAGRKKKDDSPHWDWELETLVRSFFHPTLLLDYLQFFVQFEEDNGKLIKKIAAYHQFNAVREAVRCTITASGINSDLAEPRADYANRVKFGSKQAGVIWHTQGSGKSLSMLCYSAKLIAQPEMKNPTIVVVTDRNDLDGQLYQTFCKGQELLGQMPIQAESREALRTELAKRDAGGIIFTTIQKFGLKEDEIAHLVLNQRHNIVVIADEAHRTQYGFQGKYNNEGIMKFGFAKYLRDALPNASFIGFTGTPISLEDKDTRAVFGDYVSIYDIQDAVNDGATVPIYYEPRLIRLDMSNNAEQILNEMAQLVDDDDDSEKTKSAVMKMENILGTEQRIAEIAKDIIQHYEQRNQLMDGKAMVVALSRALCVKLYNAIIALRPEWHSSDPNQGAIKIIMTANANDPADWQQHNYSTQNKKVIERRFKDPDDNLRIVIVRDMWLTGFDVPCLHTMYIDKPMQGHNLMQAIARVNRVYPSKSKENGGLIVSYLPLDTQLKEALKTYTDAKGRGEMALDIHKAFDILQENLGKLEQILNTPAKKGLQVVRCQWQDFEQNPLLAMKNAVEHILSLAIEDQKRIEEEKHYAKNNKLIYRPRRNVKLKFCDYALAALHAYGLCSTLPEAQAFQHKVAFFNAIKPLLSQHKNGQSGKQEREQLKKMLNNAVIPTGIADIFSLTGLNVDKIEVSLMSAQFLDSVAETPYPHTATSVLEKLINDEIRSKLALNEAKSRDFKERLEAVLGRYNSNIDTVREIIKALIELAEELHATIQRGNQLGLSESELAFYDALNANKSAEQLLGEKVLVELAKEIIHMIQREATIDWQYRENIRAKLQIYVKRLLKKYRYPPDKAQDAVERVLLQAELTADQFSR